MTSSTSNTPEVLLYFDPVKNIAGVDGVCDYDIYHRSTSLLPNPHGSSVVDPPKQDTLCYQIVNSSNGYIKCLRSDSGGVFPRFAQVRGGILTRYPVSDANIPSGSRPTSMQVNTWLPVDSRDSTTRWFLITLSFHI